MEIRLLKYFLAVAREGSISGAAEALHITQPTLSRQLKDLENELDTTLFIRGNRNITLTDDGLLLRKRAEEIIMLVDKTEQEFLHDDIVSGDLHIGGGETDGMRLIAGIIKKLQSKYPHVKVHLFSGNADDISEKLDKGILDFCIFIGSVDIKKYDYLQLPLKDKWGLLMRKDSPLSSHDIITPNDLWDLPLLVSRQAVNSNELSGWMGSDFEKLNIVATYNLIYNASLMVEEGVGYALCIDKLVNTTETSNLCFKPLSPNMESNLYIAWKKHQTFSTSGMKFLKMVQEELL